MRRKIWVALVVGFVLVGVASGQKMEEDGDVAVVQRIWDDVVAQGGFADENEFFAKFVEALRKELGAENPATLGMMNRIASKLYKDGDYAGARELEEEVLAIRRRVMGPDHPDTLTTKNNLAATLMKLADYQSTQSRVARISLCIS